MIDHAALDRAEKFAVMRRNLVRLEEARHTADNLLLVARYKLKEASDALSAKVADRVTDANDAGGKEAHAYGVAVASARNAERRLTAIDRELAVLRQQVAVAEDALVVACGGPPASSDI